MKIAKPSPKKGNVNDIAERTVFALEFQKQNLQHDVKNWNEQIPSLEISVDKIVKAAKKELLIQTQELNKEFTSTQAKVSKLCHEIEAVQKKFNKGQAEFETKLADPFTKGVFNNQTTTQAEALKANI